MTIFATFQHKSTLDLSNLNVMWCASKRNSWFLLSHSFSMSVEMCWFSVVVAVVDLDFDIVLQHPPDIARRFRHFFSIVKYVNTKDKWIRFDSYFIPFHSIDIDVVIDFHSISFIIQHSNKTLSWIGCFFFFMNKISLSNKQL